MNVKELVNVRVDLYILGVCVWSDRRRDRECLDECVLYVIYVQQNKTANTWEIYRIIHNN